MFEVLITKIDGHREIYDGLSEQQAQSCFFIARMNPCTHSVVLNKWIDTTTIT